MELEHLFKPGRIGSLQLKNRIVMAPMHTQFGTREGRVTDRIIDYYAERAKGGAGLIITEPGCVHRYGTLNPYILNIYDDRYIPRLGDLADAVHANGAKVGMQLLFVGLPQSTGFHQLPAPSPIGNRAWGLSIEEIRIVVEAYGTAAQRAKMSGFDLVEVHACHGSLPSLFLSPYYNRRTDEYGGETGMARFVLEILASIKKKTGDDFPVIFRINGDDFIDDRGVKLKDACITAKRLESEGVAAIDVSSGIEFRDSTKVIPPTGMSTEYRFNLAAGVKEVVRVPVIASGGITDPRLGEEILRRGDADLVAFGRALIADPDLPTKAKEGRFDDIRPCIRCMQGHSGARERTGLTCLGNAAAGNEKEYALKRAETVKRVVVVGGGPSGMEAARVAALRGHKVTLYEKSQELGGQFLLGGVIPHKDELNGLTRYLARQVVQLGVKVELGKEATSQTMEEIKPDVIVVAVGAEPIRPLVPGVEGQNVVTAHEVLEGKAKTGNKVIVVGGGRVGCETAEFLAGKGMKVTLVVTRDELARDMPAGHRAQLLRRLDEWKVSILTRRRLKDITPEGVVCSSGVFGTPPEETIKGDTIVLAVGTGVRREVVDQFKSKAAEVYTIGDCEEPRTALEAIHEGFHIGRVI